ncbi:MAG TPA: hypothetical protein VFG90_05955 [Nitrososphaeraceae archaeon]|nr:hypothetical protein [Nitrososphaeraceae archaeon]
MNSVLIPGNLNTTLKPALLREVMKELKVSLQAIINNKMRGDMPVKPK